MILYKSRNVSLQKTLSYLGKVMKRSEGSRVSFMLSHNNSIVFDKNLTFDELTTQLFSINTKNNLNIYRMAFYIETKIERLGRPLSMQPYIIDREYNKLSKSIKKDDGAYKEFHKSIVMLSNMRDYTHNKSNIWTKEEYFILDVLSFFDKSFFDEQVMYLNNWDMFASNINMILLRDKKGFVFVGNNWQTINGEAITSKDELVKCDKLVIDKDSIWAVEKKGLQIVRGGKK